MGRKYLFALVIGLLATSVAWAQANAPAQGKEGKGRHRQGKGAPADALTNIDKLTEALKLDATQQTQIKQILAEFEEAKKTAESKTPQDVRNRRNELLQQMREAQRNRDKQKTQEIGKQLRELGKTDPAMSEMAGLRSQLTQEIEKVLREDQKQEFRKLIPGARKGGASLRSPQMMRMCLAKLQLRPDQKAEIAKIEQASRDAYKALDKGAGPAKKAEIGQKYYDDVMKVLDAAQKQQLEQIAAEMGSLAGAAALSSPKLLEDALKTIQLRPDQQTTITALFDRYKTDRKAVAKDAAAAGDLSQKLITDVLAALDQPQKEQIAKWHPAGGGHKGGKGKGAAQAGQQPAQQ